MRSMILWAIVSYLIGSLPTGYVITKLFHRDENGKRDGLDIRTVGSGAIGATNVRRAMGQGWSWVTGFIDIFKGAFALLLAAHITPQADLQTAEIVMSIAALAVVIGHNYPVWLRFKGGKGVATTYGTLFFIWPPKSFAVVLLCAAIWYIIMKVSRYVSLASMLSLIAMPICFAMLGAPAAFIILSAILAALGVFRHRSNIVRLMHGTENRLK